MLSYAMEAPAMNLPDFLIERPDGTIVLTGHRIGLYHVVQFYNDGFSPEMLAEQFPTLSLALIHKVIACYLENRVEVDTYVASVRGELDRQRAAGRNPDLADLRRRLTARQAAETPAAPGH